MHSLRSARLGCGVFRGRAPDRGAARVLLAAALAAGALVLFLFLRVATAPGTSPTAALPPAAAAPSDPATQAGPAPELPPRIEVPEAEAPEVERAAGDEDAEGKGTIEVVVTGQPAGSSQETLVLAMRWRSHPAAAVEVAGELVIPAALDRGSLLLGGGVYALVARSPGWASAPVRVEVGDPPARTEVELPMVACAAVRGFVLDQAGDPVPDLAVHLTDATGQLLGSGLTALGGFELPCVPPGPWSLAVGALEGPVVGPLEVVVPAGGAALADVVLPPLGAVEILVRDEAGAPVSDLELDGQGETGGRMRLSTDFDGRAASELALPGLWRFFADAGPLGRGNAVLEIEAGGRAQATLTLRRR